MRKSYPCPMGENYFKERKPTAGFSLLDKAELKGKLLLDLGAFGGYVARYCAMLGAIPVLIDIFSSAMSPSWPRIEGDKECLPFRDGVFDMVACNDTLHHGDLEKTAEEVFRILKPGGVFISTREPCIGSWENEQVVLKKDCQRQLLDGIEERRPNLTQYRRFCAKFNQSEIFSCYPWGPAQDANYGGEGIAIRCRR